MSSNTNQGGFCKTVCWVLGIAVGGYAAYALSADFQVDQLQSGILGIVTALLVGLILRRVLCGGNSNRLRKRLEETPVQSEKEASAVMASATAKVEAAQAVEKIAEKPTETPKPKPTRVKSKSRTKSKSKSKVEKPKDKPFAAPAVDKIDEKLVEKVVAAEPAVEPEEDPVQGENAPLKLSSILEVSPDTPEETEALIGEAPKVEAFDPKPGGIGADEIVISGDYGEDEVSEATKAVIADIAPAMDEPAPTIVDTPAQEAEVAAEEAMIEPEPQPDQEPDPEPVAAEEDAAPKIKPLEPTGLDEPENGMPDELEQIDGIGEDQMTALHKAGIYHFTQFVTMNRRELAWLDENIPGGGDDAAGNWRKQAIQLSRKAG